MMGFFIYSALLVCLATRSLGRLAHHEKRTFDTLACNSAMVVYNDACATYFVLSQQAAATKGVPSMPSPTFPVECQAGGNQAYATTSSSSGVVAGVTTTTAFTSPTAAVVYSGSAGVGGCSANPQYFLNPGPFSNPANLNTAHTTAPCIATYVNMAYIEKPSALSFCTGSGNDCIAAVQNDGGWGNNACGLYDNLDDASYPLIAIPQAIFDTGRTFDSSGNGAANPKYCGKNAMIRPAGSTANFSPVRIVDRCGCGCSVPNGVDLSAKILTDMFGFYETPNARVYVEWYIDT